MKSEMVSLFWVLAVLVCPADRAAAQRHEGWVGDFQTAEQKSKTDKIPLLVHFYADWCGPCRAMERDVLNTADVSRALTNGIIAVKVNSDTRRDLVARFGVTSLPTDIFVSPEGTVLGKFVGSPGRAGYLARLTRFRETRSVPGTEEKEAIAAGDAGPPSRSPIAAGTGSVPVQPTATQNVATDGNDRTEVVLASRESTAKTDLNSELDAGGEERDQTPKSQPKAQDAVAAQLTRALRRDASKRIGLNGYCPVSLQTASEWQPGTAEFKYEFQGVCYLLKTADDLERFKVDPEKFIPVLHGYDPVALQTQKKMQTGAIELGARYRDRVYFFASRSNRDTFLRNPGQYSKPFELSFFSVANDMNAEL